jgi:hypothetical protein
MEDQLKRWSAENIMAARTEKLERKFQKENSNDMREKSMVKEYQGKLVESLVQRASKGDTQTPQLLKRI